MSVVKSEWEFQKAVREKKNTDSVATWGHYRWCGKHSMAYNIRRDKQKVKSDGTGALDCPLCIREERLRSGKWKVWNGKLVRVHKTPAHSYNLQERGRHE